MLDVESGKTWVAGHGPSERIRNRLDKQVADSREKLGSGQVDETVTGTRPPPRTWFDWSSWLALAGGGASLLAVALFLLKQRSAQ